MIKNTNYSLTFVLSILVFVICLSSCKKNDSECDDDLTSPMNLDDLEIGDRFLFAYLQGDSYHDDENFVFNYTADTLELLITDFVDGHYVIQERILPTSLIFQNNGNYLNKDSIYYNKWHIENDNLKISSDIEESNSSHIFQLYFVNEINFPLEEFDDEEVEIIGWKTEYSYVGHSHNYYTKDFMLLGNAYERLNVMIRNTGMVVDANGWTYLYSKDNGFARVISYSAWTTNGWGWDRL